jgi:Na+-driven multidrug efflux pump
MVLLFLFTSRFLAGLFNENPLVQETIVMYLRIVSIGYGFHGMLLLSVSALNVLHKPIHAASLSLLQMFILFLPLAIAGSHYFGVRGIFAALALAYVLSGLSGRAVLSGMIESLRKQ